MNAFHRYLVAELRAQARLAIIQDRTPPFWGARYDGPEPTDAEIDRYLDAADAPNPDEVRP